MTAVKDVEEALKVWRDSTLTFKVFTAIFIFMGISSVTSLSDIFFGWKGFILDGVLFYKEWVVSPIIQLGKQVGLSWSEDRADYLILASLSVAHWIRMNWLFSRHPAIPVLFEVIFSFGLLVMLALAIYMHSNNPEPLPSHSIFIALFILLGLPYLWGFTRSYKIAYYTPLTLTVTAVLVLGAANIALSQ